MAKKKYIPKKTESDGLRPEERMAQKFAEQLIEKLGEAKLDWEKPWFTNVNMGAPRNFDGRRYNGMNQFFLALKQEEMGYQLPIWITFQKAKELGVNILKGEKSMTVWLGSRIIKDKEGNNISPKEYNGLSEEEKNECIVKPFAKAFTVFNIQQTNYPEIFPEKYSALKESMKVNDTLKDEKDMLAVPALDDMLKNESWFCKIQQKQSDDAYYSISKDEIVVPLKGQFVDGESFYKTLLHEMAHSTGAENRLNRLVQTSFGSAEYAREELVAEMTAAIVANTIGFSSGIKEDSVAYIQSWLDSLKESPKFMLSVMKDVNKACAMVEGQVLNKDMKISKTKEVEADEMMEEEVKENVAETVKEPVEEIRAQGVPEKKGEYYMQQQTSPKVYGMEKKEKKLNKAFLGNGIAIWEDGDNDYTAHISPQRVVTLQKEFSQQKLDEINKLAKQGNMSYKVDDNYRKMILEPLNIATHLIYNPVTQDRYPVSIEIMDPDKPENRVYCSQQQILSEDVKERLVEIKYPQEYIFSITGMENIRPVFYKLAQQGMDFSEMQEMLQITDEIIEKKALEKDEMDFKVLYFQVKDNKVVKFNRLADELGTELPRYWFHDNRLCYNHPGKEKAKNQSDAQILAGGEAIIRVRGTENYNSAVNSLAEKGIAMLPKLEAEMRLFAQVVENLTDKQRKNAAMYLFVKDGLVVDTEPNIHEKEYDVPKFIYDGIDFKRLNAQEINEKKDITHQLNNKNMENKKENNQEARKEVKDGLYLFPMKSGDYGIKEVKNGVSTPTIPISKGNENLKEFFEAVKGKGKEVRNEELKKLADKYLTPENIKVAEERKAQREQEAANGEKKGSEYVRLPEAKPEVRARIENARVFLMADKKTWASSADIDGAHMSKPMGEKLQNTFLAKLGAINAKDGESKGQSPEAKELKAELYINTAAMTFHKELSAPKQEQEQSAGMKR